MPIKGLSFKEKLTNDGLMDLATRRFILMKEALSEVSIRMSGEELADVAKNDEDKLGWSMTFLRAAKNINLKTMKKCADAYPSLKSLCNPEDPNLRISNVFLQIKEHAVELACNAITSELTALQGNGELLDPQVKARKKENILTRIKRLLPGSLGGLNAMRNEAGEITTGPKGHCCNT